MENFIPLTKSRFSVKCNNIKVKRLQVQRSHVKLNLVKKGDLKPQTFTSEDRSIFVTRPAHNPRYMNVKKITQILLRCMAIRWGQYDSFEQP